MATTVGELNAILRLKKSSFDSGMGQAEGRFKRFGGTAGKLGKLVTRGAAVAVAAAAVAGTKALVDFDTGMRQVFTLMPGITDQARKAMEDDVLSFARAAGVVPGKVMPALYQAISAGVPPDNVFTFLETANKAAVGGITDLETSVDGITSVVNAYGADVLSAAEASDLMFTAVRLGKTDFGQLSDSLFQVIPTAAALGVKFGDVTGALAQMTAQGTPTRVATTQLRQLFVELSKEGGKASGAFKELSGKSFAEFVKAGGDVADALETIQRAADDNGVAIQDMFGSVEAGQAALALSGPNLETYRDNLDEMGSAAGATDLAFEEMDQGLARTWDKIKATIAVGITVAAQWVFTKLGELKAFWDENWDAIKATFLAVWAVIMDSPLVFLIKQIPDALSSLRLLWDRNWESIKKVAEAVWKGIQKAMEIGVAVFDWIIGKLAELVGLWRRNWEDIQSVLEAVWRGIRTAVDVGIVVFVWIKDLVLGLVELWKRNWEDIQSVLEAVWRGIQTAVDIGIGIFGWIKDLVLELVGLWKRNWESIQSVLETVWAVITTAVEIGIKIFEWIKTGVVTAKDIWVENWDTIKTALETTWDVIKGAVDIGVAIFEIIQTAVLGLVKLWGTNWDTIVRVLETTWNVITGAVTIGIEVFQWIKDGLTGVKDDWVTAWNVMSGAVETGFSGITGVITGVMNAAIAAVEFGVNSAISLVNALIRAYNSLPGPDISQISRVSIERIGSGLGSLGKYSQSASELFGAPGLEGGFGRPAGSDTQALAQIAEEANTAWVVQQNALDSMFQNAIDEVILFPHEILQGSTGPLQVLHDAVAAAEQERGSLISGLPALHTGGRVPGPPGTDQMAMLRAGETVGRSGLGGGGGWPSEMRLILGDDQGDDLAEFLMDRGVHLLRSSQGMHT